MKFVTLVLVGLSLTLTVGCTGGGMKAAKTVVNDSNNNGSGDVDTPDEPVVPEDPGTENPTPQEPPVSTVPGTPGDKVAISTGSSETTYPAVGAVQSTVPNPKVEPNTDPYPPIVAIVSHPPAYIPQTSGTVTVWAADDVNGIGVEKMECSIDGGAYAACTSTVPLSNLSEGNHSVSVRAQDYDGNMSGEASYVFYVDTKGPSVTIPVAPPAVSKSPNASFEFESVEYGSGVAYYQCRVDSNPLATCTDTKAFTNLSEGSHAVYVRAVDNVGNKGETVVYRWTIDTQGPVISYTAKPNPVVYIENGAPIVRFTAVDAVAPTGVVTTCTLNGMAVACASATNVTVPATTPGNYTFTVVATDTNGNSTTSTTSWQSVFESENKSSLFTVNEDRPVDILFVVDNSGSMDYERSNLAERIDGMIEKIEGLNWQIAVTSTDATSTNAISDGQLIPLDGLPGEFILDSTMDVMLAQEVFGNTVQNFAAGSGTEEGIYASKRVIDRFVAGQAIHTQFIRDNADLSIVVLSDEDERSNGQGLRITPQGFVNFVNTTFNGQKNMVFHSIITKPNDSVCLNGEGESYGNTYDALSRLTGFGQVGGAIIGSVCSNDYATQLEKIGQSVKDLQNSMTLSCNPHDANKDGKPDITLMYRADSGSAFAAFNGAYTVSGKMLTFTDLLPPGEFKADYKCKIN